MCHVEIKVGITRDPENSTFGGWEPHQSMEETLSLRLVWISEYSQLDDYHWALVWKELSEAIGYIYLSEIRESPAEGWFTFPCSKIEASS